MAKRTAGTTRTTRYAIYLRCSSDDQAQGDFTTLDTQRELNTQYVVERGGVLIKEYSDEGKTGTNIKRPGFEALTRDAREGLFDVVVVTYMSRLARGEAYHVAEYLLKQEKVGVELVREKFTADLGGHMGKQMTIMMDGMYPKMVSGWTKTKQEQMVAHGYFTGGLVPFGYRKEIVIDAAFTSRNDKEPPKRLVPDPEYAPFVRRAFEVFVETGSYNRAADYLRSVTPRKWTVDGVRHVLQNEVYKGVLRFGEHVNPAAYEPIISEALWEAVLNAKENRPVRSVKQNIKDTRPYYLRHLVFCVHCEGRMTPAGHYGANRQETSYYECLAAHRKLTTGCPAQRVNATALHNALLTEIARCAKHPTRIQGYINEAIKALPDTSEVRKELAVVEKRIRETEKKIGQITTAIEDGGAMRALLERLQTLEAERTSLTTERVRLEVKQAENGQRRPQAKEVAALWANFMELWEEMTEEERTQVMGLLVERVDIHTKEEGTCKIRFSGQVPISSVVTTQTNRASAVCISNNFPASLYLRCAEPLQSARQLSLQSARDCRAYLCLR